MSQTADTLTTIYFLIALFMAFVGLLVSLNQCDYVPRAGCKIVAVAFLWPAAIVVCAIFGAVFLFRDALEFIKGRP